RFGRAVVLGVTVALSVPMVVSPASAQTPGCTPPASGGSPVGHVGGFHPVTPVRLLDTRPSAKVGDGCVAEVDVAAVAPVDATGIALNVTTVNAEARGFVTAYACGSPRPSTSNVNPRVGDPTPNLVIVTLDSSRKVCLFTFSATDLVVDATGWFGTGGDLFHEVAPARLVDTRTLGPALPAGTDLPVPVTGVPATAVGVAVNLTITEPADPGFATVHPCGTAVPPTSTVNYLAGENRANQTMVGLGNGAVCVFVVTTAHVIVDLAGWFGPGDSAVPLELIEGSRLVDSRNGTGGFDGAMTPGETRQFDPNVAGTAPDGSHVVVLNVVATQASARGYLTVYPCRQGLPPTSSVNYAPGNESTNLVSVPIDADGKICVFSFERTHVVIDLFGAFGAPGTLRAFHLDGLALDPPFRPDFHDYVLHCAAGSNTITFEAVPMPGVSVTVDGVATLTGARTLQPNGAVRVDAGGQEYFVRCLPADFPAITAVRSGPVAPGYYLMEDGVASTGGRFLMMLDTNGVPVWYRRVSPGEVDFKLLSNGDLASMPFVRTVFNIDDSLGYNERKIDGTVVRTVNAAGNATDYHDLLLLPNGNYVVVTYRQRTVASLPPTFGSCGANDTVVDGVIQEVTPTGALVSEWSSDLGLPGAHISAGEVVVPLCDSTAVTGSSPPTNAVDYMHINAVDYDAATNQVVVTARHLNSIFWIDWSTKKVVRKLGGQGTNPDNPAVFTFTGGDVNAFALPHDGRLNPNGHLTAFDNQAAPKGNGNPRAVEYALDAQAKTATLLWQRPLGATGSLFGGLGGVRRQPDGNTVIAWGGFNDPVFTEVDPTGAARLQVSMPIANLSYRVTKIPASAFTLDELHATTSG
ncbi:MAG TPA: aryl-sulfate sulfotransferase, partial [Acidimicrobiales bacterium]|nr:aryl-sulfate sulfotransferase [Acidimicrobiales bacterium]